LIFDSITRNIMKLKLLLDTNVQVSGLSSRLGASFALLEAAVNGHVDALVTHNLADFEIAKTRFSLNVWTPANALKKLEKQL
jgi:predicted nucleic acid-binding protein